MTALENVRQDGRPLAVVDGAWPRQPFDPLSADEIRGAVDVLRRIQNLDESTRFVAVYLHEPPKDAVLAGLGVGNLPREAFAVLLDRTTGQTYEAVVSLSDGTVRDWRHVPGVQPAIMLDEFDEVEAGAKRSPEFVQALAARGVTDLDLVCVEPWSAGYYGEDPEGRRLMRALVYMRFDADDNPYAHPVDLLVVVYDLNRGEVVKVEDDGPVPVPRQGGNYTPDRVQKERGGLKPIDIVQPDGPSFELDGHRVRWQGWTFHIGFTPREGVVLHDVRIRDGEQERAVVYRASLSEMVVPYGDPASVQYRKNAFDAGEYNIGALANSLELGCDCLGEIRYLDATMNNSRGAPVTLRNAVCLHEEDAGLLWKHTDYRTGKVEVRRSRKLVVSFIATVANYEYAFYWNLFQDGTLELQIKATGIVSTATAPSGQKAPFGQLLNADGLYAPIHQHVFNVRLDMDVDGGPNAVYEVHTEVPDGVDNPYGSAFRTVETLLRSEKEAIRDADPSSQRFWRVVNRDRRNAVGEPTAYRLVPSHPTRLFASPQSHVAQRAGFALHNLWVTPFAENERFAAGDYPNQSRGGDGLPAWTAADRPLVDEDLVLWYSFGSHHVVRLEDWPVMPVQVLGFRIEPEGFFDSNPALDVPPSRHCVASTEGPAGGSQCAAGRSA